MVVIRRIINSIKEFLIFMRLLSTIIPFTLFYRIPNNNTPNPLDLSDHMIFYVYKNSMDYVYGNNNFIEKIFLKNSFISTILSHLLNTFFMTQVDR